VDLYGPRLLEELENENVRCAHINTRKKPDLTEDERLREVPTNYLPLIISCDWHETSRIHNASVIEYSGKGYRKIANDIALSLSDWGRCYVWGHRVISPIFVKSEKSYVKIKPFALNGPHADEYLLRLDALGISIGRAVGGYLLEKRSGRTILR
jgi:hypothetical protein